jgi:hypothetical protein
MRTLLAVASLAALLTQAATASYAAADPGIRQERVQFAKGASSAVIAGKIKGDADVDYLVRARAGQTLSVTLKESNPQNYFNILPPGTDMAMFVGSDGADFTRVLPADGDYTIRVYLMRPAARRNEASDYTLSVTVTGSALAPLPASKDALIPGTPFHASATITCVPFLETQPRDCEAFVIRRGFDGTATVEVPQANSLKRCILFVKGEPVASDSPDPLTATRQGDVTTVKLGTDERYDIPDMLVSGG